MWPSYIFRIGVMVIWWFAACGLFLAQSGWAADVPGTISRVKPAIVGIGTYQKTRRPPAQLLGTGFAVHDGSLVLTNAHVLPVELDALHYESLVAVIPGDEPEIRNAEVVARDNRHDLALLRISGSPLPALELSSTTDKVREGEIYLFTGFPIGAVLGLHPATHRAMIAAITPIVIPADQSARLDPATIRRLRDPYDVFQLDGTAYPGNSGSPLYDKATGRVVGIINKVFVKGTKENVLTHPSGISYAIPSDYAYHLLNDYVTD